MWSLLSKAVDEFFRHKSARLGAALAYYSVFSLGPLPLIVTSVAGFIRSYAVRASLTSKFQGMLGETRSQAVEAMLKGAESDRRDFLSQQVEQTRKTTQRFLYNAVS